MADEHKPEDEGRPGSKRLSIWKFCVAGAAKVTGGLVGVGTTALTGDPFVGAAAGTSLAHSLEKGGLHIIESKLGPRQAVRIGRTLTVAAVRMEERVSAGETPREDSFSQPDANGRSDAEETVEAALFAAMNSVEEKKVDFIGLLLTSIAFDSTITASDAQMMIETAQILRYRAFVILKIANDVQVFGWPARGREDVEGPPAKLYPLMAQIYEMSRRGLIEMRDKPDDNDNYAILGADEIDPSKLHLSPLGKLLYKNMELQRLPESDATYVRTAADLKALSGYGKGAMRINAGVDGGEF